MLACLYSMKRAPSRLHRNASNIAVWCLQQWCMIFSDFAACMLSPAVALLTPPPSTVRDAMVRIMLTDESPECPSRHHHREAPSPFQPSPTCCQGKEDNKHRGLVGEGYDDTRQPAFGERSTNVDESWWSSALVDARGAQALPRDSSTCTLWCAVALGALVRGHPLSQVGAFLPCGLSRLPCTHSTVYQSNCLGFVFLRAPASRDRQCYHGYSCWATLHSSDTKSSC